MKTALLSRMPALGTLTAVILSSVMFVNIPSGTVSPLSFHAYAIYCKVPKLSDTRKLCCNLPKIQTKRQNLRVFCQKDANGKANSADQDQTAPFL